LLLAGGVWLARTEYDGYGLRVGVWCLVGVFLVAGVSLITIQYEAAQGVTLHNVPVVVGASGTGGGVFGFLIGGYDAARRRSERRMAAERERAKRLSQRLSVLNRVLRHDIRNEVTVIHGNAERILDGVEEDAPALTIKRKVTELHRLSESAREMESLLAFEEIPTETVDIADLIEAERRSLIRDGTVDIETSIPDEAWATANPKIDTAVGHIVENAIEHNDSESPKVEIDVSVSEEEVELVVADNGPGLPEEEVNALERGHETDIDHASGLGLWLANWVVTESDGDLTFECDDPGGTTVRINLPRARPPV
jgi:signal transduction histidine kinase